MAFKSCLDIGYSLILCHSGNRAKRKPPEGIFDPALRHKASALIPADSLFQNSERHKAWNHIRRWATHHLLRLTAGSPWSELLVLRGSLLTACLGDAAREPRDINWVFQPPDIEMQSPRAQKLIDDLIEMVSRHSQIFDSVPNAVIIFDVDRIATHESGPMNAPQAAVSSFPGAPETASGNRSNGYCL